MNLTLTSAQTNNFQLSARHEPTDNAKIKRQNTECFLPKPKKRSTAKKQAKKEIIITDGAYTTRESDRIPGSSKSKNTNDILSFDISNFGPDFFCNSPR